MSIPNLPSHTMQLFRHPGLRIKARSQLCTPITAASRASHLNRRNQFVKQRVKTLVTRTSYTARSKLQQLYIQKQRNIPNPRPISTTTPLKGTQEGQTTSPTTTTTDPAIHSSFEPQTGSWQYIVADPSTNTAVIIDPVLDYDRATQAISTSTADALLSLVKERSYNVNMILETHVHADHITAASYLQNRLAEDGGKRPVIGIGKGIEQVQRMFGGRYGVPEGELTGVFGKLFEDGEVFSVGNLKGVTMHLPGHTPDHLGYKIGDNIFCGDTLFHADIGSARCDFPGGSAQNLYATGRKLLSLPDDVKIWTGHDYPPENRGTPVPWTTVGEHKKTNKHFKLGITEEEFVAVRQERDAMLAAPKLLHQSLQMNIRAGKLPRPTETGLRMLHLPLKMGGLDW